MIKRHVFALIFIARYSRPNDFVLTKIKKSFIGFTVKIVKMAVMENTGQAHPTTQTDAGVISKRAARLCIQRDASALNGMCLDQCGSTHWMLLLLLSQSIPSTQNRVIIVIMVFRSIVAFG